jgi:hypothetical protein
LSDLPVSSACVDLRSGGLFGDLDRDALATAGVDIDAVRATIEASFGHEALTRAIVEHRDPAPLPSGQLTQPGDVRRRAQNGVDLHGAGERGPSPDAVAGMGEFFPGRL